jgi:hypothetical protein
VQRQRPVLEYPHKSGTHEVVHKVYRGAECHAPHVSNDHIDHEDRDQCRVKHKGLERTSSFVLQVLVPLMLVLLWLVLMVLVLLVL